MIKAVIMRYGLELKGLASGDEAQRRHTKSDGTEAEIRTIFPFAIVLGWVNSGVVCKAKEPSR